jgi:hypothetical protein
MKFSVIDNRRLPQALNMALYDEPRFLFIRQSDQSISVRHRLVFKRAMVSVSFFCLILAKR